MNLIRAFQNTNGKKNRRKLRKLKGKYNKSIIILMIYVILIIIDISILFSQ